jgi:hypothetical protein
LQPAAGVIVGDDDFKRVSWPGLPEQPLVTEAQSLEIIVMGDYDRYEWQGVTTDF